MNYDEQNNQYVNDIESQAIFGQWHGHEQEEVVSYGIHPPDELLGTEEFECDESNMN